MMDLKFLWKALLIGLFTLLLTFLYSQESYNTLNIYGLERNLKGMKVSAGWSALSVGSGAVGFFQTDDKRWKAFHATNATFGLLNSLVVLKGTRDLKNGKSADWNFQETVDQHRKIERLYLFNNGFNYAFIFGGLFLKEKSKSMSSMDKQLIYKGIGESLVTQGIFFLLFDTSMYFIQKDFNDTKLGQLIPDGISMNGSQIGFSWNLN